MKTITLDDRVIQAIAGHCDEALRLIEERFRVRLAARGNDVTVSNADDGSDESVGRVAELLRQIGELHEQGVALNRDDLKAAVALIQREPNARLAARHDYSSTVWSTTSSSRPDSVASFSSRAILRPVLMGSSKNNVL